MSNQDSLPLTAPKIKEVGPGIGNQLQIKMSRGASSKWQEIFNKKWKGHSYNMKRDAVCNGQTITLHAPAEEFLTYHKVPLEQIIAATHADYLEFEKKKAEEDERQRKQADEEQQKRQKHIDEINEILRSES